MAILPCACGAAIRTDRSQRDGNKVRCMDCGRWVIDPRDPEEVMAEQAVAETWVEFYACPGCGATLAPVQVGKLATADTDVIACKHCTYLIDDGPTTERVYQQDELGRYQPVDVPMRAAHRASSAFVVADLRKTARLLQRIPLAQVLSGADR